MAKNDMLKSMRKFLSRIIIVCALLVLAGNVFYLLMTWLVRDIVGIEQGYLSSEFQFLGTLVILLSILIVIFMAMYRRRKKELTTLSESIEKVAHGQFGTKIKFSENDSMAHVYQDFNKMSDELANVQLLRKDFVNSFSHEFKTPLASINGFASLMLEKDLNPEDRKLYLQIIRDETDRLSRLTSNTLLLTRLSTQEIVTDIESYDLGEQLRQCAILLSHEWMEKQQTFLGEFPQIFYTGNRELMQHLWLNLMGNAIRYTPSGGTVTIDLFRKEQQITVRIADTGQGMDAFTQEHLFDAYYRGDKNHTSPGLGLGLAIVRQILDLCQGEIQVQSTPGQGSVFTVLLPV